MTTPGLVVGILVGGRGSRMGGRKKGLLRGADGVPLVERIVAIARETSDTIVLVGPSEGYEAVDVGVIPDERPERGPLGGLVALLAHAHGHPAIALACDLPYVTHALLSRLAAEAPLAGVLAPRSADGVWEPLFARYDSGRALPPARRRLEAGELALQPLLDELSAHELTLDDEERTALRDWDRPGDFPPRTLAR